MKFAYGWAKGKTNREQTTLYITLACANWTSGDVAKKLLMDANWGINGKKRIAPAKFNQIWA